MLRLVIYSYIVIYIIYTQNVNREIPLSRGLGAQVGFYADCSVLEELLNVERRGDVRGGPPGVSA